MLRKKLKLDPLISENNSSDIQENRTKAAEESYIVHKIQKVEVEPSLACNKTVKNISSVISSQILDIELNLCEMLKQLTFSAPVAYVYNPLYYASKPHTEFTQRYCNSVKPVLFVGMNPGPFGMCQTGVPFGEVKAVQNFLGIESNVFKPDRECPDRPVLGFDCKRSEISGLRFWGYFQQLCGTSEYFFKNAFVYNYCPLAFMKSNGGNITPSEIKGMMQKKIEEICDEALLKILKLLKVEKIIGIGKFAEKRALQVLQKSDLSGVRVYFMPHPSPRAVNNHNWPQKAEAFLRDNDLMKYFLPL